MKEYSDLLVFVRVVREGSFSGAARTLGLSPSAISKQISSLENELGARLFQRTTRKQSLTEAGETYLVHAEKAITMLSEAKMAVNRLTEKVSGSLHIASEPDLATTFISPYLAEFFQHYPELDIRLNVSAGLVNLVESEVDIAIRMGHLKDSSLLARRLGTSYSILCATPKYLKDNGLPSAPADLEQHNCLSFRIGAEKRHWQFVKDGTEFSIAIKGNFRVNNLTLIKHAVLDNVGVAMMPTWIIKSELEQQRLLPILPEYQLIPANTPINAIYSHRQHLAPKIRAFIDFFNEKISQAI